MPTGSHPNSKEQLKKSRLDLVDKEEARKIQRLGGIAATTPEVKEKIKLKKNFKEAMKELLAMNVGDEKVIGFIKKMFPNLHDDDITNRVAIITSAVARAIKGDMRAVEIVRDTCGEKPVDKIHQTNLDLDIDLSSMSTETLEAIKDMTTEELVNLSKNIKTKNKK